MDAFQTVLIPLKDEIQSILQYFISFSGPTPAEVTWKDPSDISQLGQHLLTVKQVVNGCQLNETHMLSLLTATAASMEEVSGQSLSDQHIARLVMTRAISHLCRDLHMPPRLVMDEQVILNIFYLGVRERYLGGHQSALTDLRAATNVMRSWDASLPFDAFIKETMSYNDIFLAIETGSKPLFRLDWDRKNCLLPGASRILSV